MPSLHLQLSDHVRASIWQNIVGGFRALVKIEWYEDGLLSELVYGAITDQSLTAGLCNTLHDGTTWNLPVAQGLIDHVMPKAFDAYWRESLKNMGKHEIMCLVITDSMDIHFTLNPNGGMDEWLVKSSKDVSHNTWHLTIDDIITRMYDLCPIIDGWMKAAKGDIYPTLDDDDTQELPVVVLDGNDERHQFDVFAVPRLARLRDVPALVLVGKARLGYSLIVGVDGSDKWAMIVEHIDGTVGGMSIFKTMREVIDKMYELRRILVDGWQMRQETKTGRFDTILTEEWNKGVGDES